MSRGLETVGHALAFSFLEMSLIAALAWTLLLLFRNAPPALRYWIAYAGLAGMAVPFAARLLPATGSTPAQVTFTAVPVWPAWLAAVWVTGVIAMSAHALGAWTAVRRSIRSSVPHPLPIWPELCRRMETSATLKMSKANDSPFAAGWWKPVVVVPAATIAGLPPAHLEAILLHELAHIRRYDYAFGLLQKALETLLFHHPGAWWLSRVIRREREFACDALALAAGAEPQAFARALLTLEELRTPGAAPAANTSPLTARIHRILNIKEPSMPYLPILALAALVSLALAAQPAGPYKLWLEQDVAYIIEPAEKAAFEKLRSSEEQEHFIVQFWSRRDPSPGTAENEFKEEHYRRIRWANERYGWRTEQGRTYIVHGPPDEIEAHPADKYEKWFYKDLRGIGKRVSFEFGERPQRPRAANEFDRLAGEHAEQLRDAAKQFEKDIQQHLKQLQGQDRLRLEQDVQKLLQQAGQLAIKELEPTHPKMREFEAAARRLEADLSRHQEHLKTLEQNRMEQEAFRKQQDAERKLLEQDVQRLRQQADQMLRHDLQSTHPKLRELDAEARRLESGLQRQQEGLSTLERNRMEQDAFRLKQEMEIQQRKQQPE